MGQPLSRPRYSCWNCCSLGKGQQKDDDLEEYYVPQRSVTEPVSTGSPPEPYKKPAKQSWWQFWKSRRAPVSQVLEAGVSHASPRETSTVLIQHPSQLDRSKPTSRGSLSHRHHDTLESACESACSQENVRPSPCLGQELLGAGLHVPITCQSCLSPPEGASSTRASSEGRTEEVAGHCQAEDSTLELSPSSLVHHLSDTDSDSLQEFLTLEAHFLSEDEGEGAVPGCLEVQTIRTSPPWSSPESMEYEEEGHQQSQTGHVLSARYEVVALLGEGTFGQVVECIDHQEDGRHVAVKVVKDVDTDGADYAEVAVLHYLNALDPSSTHHCVRMLDWFEHRGHLCIVFELLGPSTYSFLAENGFLPFQVDHIRRMASQICQAVNFLHVNGLTHTDLKPQNILLVNPEYTEEYNSSLKQVERRLKHPAIKVADFGSTTALGWSQPCDVWSIGCILLEYYLGFPVFAISLRAHEDIEHLARMERILGPLPSDMVKKSRRGEYFSNGRLAWDEHTFIGSYVSWQCKPLKAFMTRSTEEHRHLFDLIEKMLRYNPAERITLEEALKHPFFFPLKWE